uniref:Uncharacterized protein n=1 Tax=Arundo donax TaxID=35708 RepID=A0A0A9C602_ARUDO
MSDILNQLLYHYVIFFILCNTSFLSSLRTFKDKVVVHYFL